MTEVPPDSPRRSLCPLGDRPARPAGRLGCARPAGRDRPGLRRPGRRRRHAAGLCRGLGPLRPLEPAARSPPAAARPADHRPLRRRLRRRGPLPRPVGRQHRADALGSRLRLSPTRLSPRPLRPAHRPGARRRAPGAGRAASPEDRRLGRGGPRHGRGWIEIEDAGVLLTLRGKTGWREIEVGRGSSARSCPVQALET